MACDWLYVKYAWSHTWHAIIMKKVLKRLNKSFFKGSFYKLCPIDCKMQPDETTGPSEQHFGILQKP